MKWGIKYSAHAKNDLQDIYQYIAVTLLAPDTAYELTQAIMDAVSSLNEMPLRYRQYEIEPWKSRGVRILSVKNFVVLYLPETQSHTVNIIRIMYGGRDIGGQHSVGSTDSR